LGRAYRTPSTTIGLFAPGVEPTPAVIAKLEDRRAARAAKDFKRSDAIRDELAQMGYDIKDVSGGKVEVRRRA
jgi:cysteinyl-tRNA synthetase